VHHLALVDVLVPEDLVLARALVAHVSRIQLLQDAVVVVDELLLRHHHVLGTHAVKLHLRQAVGRDAHHASLDAAVGHVEYLADAHGYSSLQRHLDRVSVHRDGEAQGSVVQGSQHGLPSLVNTPMPLRDVGTGSTPYLTTKSIFSFGSWFLNKMKYKIFPLK